MGSNATELEAIWLPSELVLAVMEVVKARDWKRTLVNLMLGCREFHGLGAKVLYKKFNISIEAGFTQAKLDSLARATRDKEGSLALVRDLVISLKLDFQALPETREMLLRMTSRADSVYVFANFDDEEATDPVDWIFFDPARSSTVKTIGFQLDRRYGDSFARFGYFPPSVERLRFDAAGLAGNATAFFAKLSQLDLPNLKKLDLVLHPVDWHILERHSNLSDKLTGSRVMVMPSNFDLFEPGEWSLKPTPTEYLEHITIPVGFGFGLASECLPAFPEGGRLKSVSFENATVTDLAAILRRLPEGVEKVLFDSSTWDAEDDTQRDKVIEDLRAVLEARPKLVLSIVGRFRNRNSFRGAGPGGPPPKEFFGCLPRVRFPETKSLEFWVENFI